MVLENRLVASWAEREVVGGIGNLGLLDTTWNGFTMRFCWVALRTLSRYLYCNRTKGEEKKKCIHVNVTWSPFCTVEKKIKKKKIKTDPEKKRLYWENNLKNKIKF